MEGQNYLLDLLSGPDDKNTSIQEMSIYERNMPYIKFYKDKLTVKYIGKDVHYSHITSVRSNKPAFNDGLVFYFEVKIYSIGERGDISVGYAKEDFPINKHLGLTNKSKSFGYKSDGKIMSQKEVQDDKLKQFQKGDYIGCGINFAKNIIFWTRNGEFLYPAFMDSEFSTREYYPTISLHSYGEQVQFNFGQKGFKFDLEKYRNSLKKESIKDILSKKINNMQQHQMVYEYLYHSGYMNTLKAYEKDAYMHQENYSQRMQKDYEEDEDSTLLSKNVKQRIREHIEKAKKHLKLKKHKQQLRQKHKQKKQIKAKQETQKQTDQQDSQDIFEEGQKNQNILDEFEVEINNNKMAIEEDNDEQEEQKMQSEETKQNNIQIKQGDNDKKLDNRDEDNGDHLEVEDEYVGLQGIMDDHLGRKIQSLERERTITSLLQSYSEDQDQISQISQQQQQIQIQEEESPLVIQQQNQEQEQQQQQQQYELIVIQDEDESEQQQQQLQQQDQQAIEIENIINEDKHEQEILEKNSIYMRDFLSYTYENIPHWQQKKQLEEIVLLNQFSKYYDNYNDRIKEFQDKERAEQILKQKDSKIIMENQRIEILQSIRRGDTSNLQQNIQNIIPKIWEKNVLLKHMIAAQKFFELLRKNNLNEAIQYTQDVLYELAQESIIYKDSSGQLKQIQIQETMSLLCYEDPSQSELYSLQTDSQRFLLCEIVNSEILKQLGYQDSSILQQMISQLSNIDEMFKKYKLYQGELFKFKV